MGGFILISLISILFKVLNPNGFGGYFAQYLYNLHLPYDLLAYFLLVACIFNIFRRLFLKKVLERTSMRDFFILISILLSASLEFFRNGLVAMVLSSGI